MYSLGQVQTKVEKKNERDEFLVICEAELERWQTREMKKMMAQSDEIQGVYGRFRKAGAVW